MKILVIGGGAREHVIAESAARSGEVFAFLKNHNPGILKIARKHKIGSETNAKAVAKFAANVKVDVAVVGPESALEAGVVNELAKVDIPAVGPDKSAARLETSKEFMRGLLEKYRIPGRLKYGVFTDMEEASDYIREFDGQVVIKPVGLTGGKGVKIEGEQLKDKEEAVEFARYIIENKYGGTAKVVVEERALGEEMTIQAFCDGERAVLMPAVQDHPHAFEGDVGPITGGMGSYSQGDGLLPFLSEEDYKECGRIMQKTIKAMKDNGTPYSGILYGQFILTGAGPRVVEYNARFGDPEAMNVLPLLKEDFGEVCMKIAEGDLPRSVKFKPLATVCKYVVPRGYGEKSEAGRKVFVDEDSIKDMGARLYYASVDARGSDIFTTSSRSVGVVGFGGSLAEAEAMAEEALEFVNGEAIYVRHDIGKQHSLNKRIRHMDEIKSS